MTNILGKMKKFAELKNPINYFIRKMIHHSVWYFWVTTTKTKKSIFFSWRKLASFTDDLHCSIYITYLSHSAYKSNFQITSSCLTVCWKKVDGILHPSSTTTSKNTYETIWWDMIFSNSIKLLSYCVSIKFLY